MQSGLILIWSGAIVNIPGGFVLCDGNNGTPDLRDRFVVGAGDSYAVDDAGGAVNHVHDFTSASHSHGLKPGDHLNFGNDASSQTTFDNDTGTTDNGSSLPPYYALAFIMKT